MSEIDFQSLSLEMAVEHEARVQCEAVLIAKAEADIAAGLGWRSTALPNSRTGPSASALSNVSVVESAATIRRREARLELLSAKSPRSGRVFRESVSEGMVITVLHYRSAAPRPAAKIRPSCDGGALQLPDPADYAARCLALGIGRECEQLIAALAHATWFDHLRATTDGPSRQIVRTASDPCAALLQATPAPHVVSIALPERPSSAQVEVARSTGRELRRRGAFVIVTTASADPALPALLGQACDCVLWGDGGMAHHSYPARTVAEPAAGRLVCYDLYDVCALWGGRIGAYGVLDPAADALHVELPSGVTTLQAAKSVTVELAADLDHPNHLRLVTVGHGRKGIPVSFTAARCITQDRVATQHSED